MFREDAYVAEALETDHPEATGLPVCLLGGLRVLPEAWVLLLETLTYLMRFVVTDN